VDFSLHKRKWDSTSQSFLINWDVVPARAGRLSLKFTDSGSLASLSAVVRFPPAGALHAHSAVLLS
jgi:hypothetical protein